MTINLLPWRERQATQQIRRYGVWLLISIMTILLIGWACCYYLNYLKSTYQLQNLHISQQISAIIVPNDAAELAAAYKNAEQQIKLIQTVNLSQQRFWQEFTFLQQRLPNNIQLTQLAWAGQELHLQGTTDQSELIGSLIKYLENSHLFSQVTLEGIDKDNQNATIRFTINVEKIQESL